MIGEAALSSEGRAVTYAPSSAGLAAFGTRPGQDPVSRGLWALFYYTLYVMAAWIVANGASLAFDLDGVGRDALGSVLLIVALTFGYGVSLRRGSRAEAKRLDAQYRQLGELTVTLGDEALSVTCRRFQLRIVWASVETIAMRHGYVVIAYAGTGRGVAIPVGAFGDEAAARSFADAARRLKDGADRAPIGGPGDPQGAD